MKFSNKIKETAIFAGMPVFTGFVIGISPIAYSPWLAAIMILTVISVSWVQEGWKR